MEALAIGATDKTIQIDCVRIPDQDVYSKEDVLRIVLELTNKLRREKGDDDDGDGTQTDGNTSFADYAYLNVDYFDTTTTTTTTTVASAASATRSVSSSDLSYFN